MTPLSCRVCAAPLSSKDIDRRLAIISCRHCGSVFDLTRTSAGASVPTPALAPEPLPRAEVRERPPVPMPERFKVERRGRHLRVQWRWFRPIEHLFLLFFAVAWNTFLVGWYYIALSIGNEGAVGWLMALFPIGHVAAGVAVGYSALTGLLNTTRLTVDPTGKLDVSHIPLPWFPAPSIEANQIEQLYAQQHTQTQNGKSTERYALFAILRDHSRVKLLDRLESLDQALWLEQEIERLLDIRDRPVSGEARP